MTNFAVDPDRLCYWDVLGDAKDLGYDIKRTVELSYVDERGTLKIFYNNEGIVNVTED